jgi:hypothetical protein
VGDQGHTVLQPRSHRYLVAIRDRLFYDGIAKKNNLVIVEFLDCPS